MDEMYKITVTDQEGNVVKEAEAEGYLVCAFNGKREIVEGITLKTNALVLAQNITTAEVASVMIHDDSPLGQAHKMLNDMHKKERRLSGLFGKLGRKER